MWLGMLQNKYPLIAAKIKAKLIEFVKMTEAKNRATPGSYWFRETRSDDPGIMAVPTARTYPWTLTDATPEWFLAEASAITVPTANALVSFGWYIDADLGIGGYVQNLKNGVVKSETPARLVYEQKEPIYMLLDFDHVMFGEEQDILGFRFYSDHDSTNDQICMAWPILFRIASRSALNLEEKV